MIRRLLRTLLRHLYAATAMRVMLQVHLANSVTVDAGRVARLAFNVADAMVAEPRRRDALTGKGRALGEKDVP